jgi:hypothetical protein
MRKLRFTAVPRTIALVLAVSASAIATAERGRQRVVADPGVGVAALVGAVHVLPAAVPTAGVAVLLPAAVGGARQTILAVARLADAITTRLRSVVADTIVRATVAVFS